ncbi:MAG: hypothetical protein ACXWVK_06775, partial [Rhodoplanes sp.]
MERSLNQLLGHVATIEGDNVDDLFYRESLLFREHRQMGKVRESVNVLRNVFARQYFQHRLSSRQVSDIVFNAQQILHRAFSEERA